MKLNVPVAIYPTTSNKLLVVGGGNFYVSDFPVQPYTYFSSEDINDPVVNLIGGGTARLGKTIYPNVPRDHNARPGKEKNTALFDYMRSLILDYPDIIEALAEELQFEDPYPAYFDIETGSSDGTFSKAEKDEIVSIQYKYKGDHGITVLHQTSQYSEKQMIIEFCNAIKSNPMDPDKRGADHLVGYFLTKFDVPYLLKRCELLGIKDFAKQALSKIDYNKYTIDYSRFTNQKLDEVVYPAEGLSCIDLFLHAKSDFALAGIASRSLKSVSNRYGLSDITDLSQEEKSDMGKLLRTNRDRFIKYAASDIRCTEFLDNIYSPRIVASANLLQCPYNLIHRMTSGQKSFVAMYREARRRNFYSFYKNAHENRYADLYMRSEKYQGATVECHKRGYFDKTIYVDCKSMYPNIMYDFNISYDRYTYLGITDYENYEGPRELTVENSDPTKLRISIPDDNYRAMLRFEIDLINDGFIRDIITKYNGIRDEYKKKSKEYEGKKDQESIKMFMNLDAVQAEAKVINNTFYGLQGNKGYEFADLPAAILVTAIGRWLMDQMKDMFKDCTIEVDTDGILLDRSIMPDLTIDQINDTLKDKIAEKFFLHERHGKLKFLLEFEGAGSVYMYKEKNYILRKDGKDKLTIKGSAFKGYDKAPVVARGVNIMSEAIMFKTKQYDIAMREALSIYDLPLEMFKMHKTLKKKLSEYKGYENLAIYCKDVNQNGSKAEVFKAIKARAKEWLKAHFVAKENGNKTNDITVCNKLIHACRTDAELDAAIEVIESYNTTTTKAAPNFMMKAIMKLMKDRKAVSYEKEIEYFYSITPDGFSFEYDMPSKKDLDYHAYLYDLGKVLERFEYADPVSEELDIF